MEFREGDGIESDDRQRKIQLQQFFFFDPLISKERDPVRLSLIFTFSFTFTIEIHG